MGNWFEMILRDMLESLTNVDNKDQVDENIFLVLKIMFNWFL